MREDVAHVAGERDVALARDAAGRALRRDAGAEQRLGGVDVADADDDPLVHEEILDRPPAPARAREEIVAVERVAERFGTEVAQQLVRAAGRLPEPATEAARVVEAQQASRIEHEVDVVVRAQRDVGREHAQRPGHAEVHDHGARLGVQQQVLRAALDRRDALAAQVGGERFRHGPAQCALAHDELAHDASRHVRRDAAARGFDFGQLGHAVQRGAPSAAASASASSNASGSPAWRSSQRAPSRSSVKRVTRSRA